MGTCNHHQCNNNAMAIKPRAPTRKLSVMEDRTDASSTIAVTVGPKKKKRALDPTFSVVRPTGTSSLGKAITDLNSQAMTLYAKGDYYTASALFRKAVSLRQELETNKTFSSSSPPEEGDQKDRQNGQHSVDQQAQSQRDAAPGCDPPQSSYIYQRLDFDEGMNVYSDVVPVYADDHPLALEATLLFNAGQSRKKLHDLDGASDLYHRALMLFLPNKNSTAHSRDNMKSIRTVHTIIIPLLHNIGQLTYRQGKLLEAIRIYDVAIRQSRELFGENHISVGYSQNCLGVILYHCSSEESDRAKTCLEEAQKILTSALGPDSAQVATAFNNLGRIYVQREEFAQARDYYEKALLIRKAQLGPDSIDYAATAFNAGQSLHQQGEYDRALSLYEEFLRVAKIKFSKNHRDIAVVLSGIAEIHKERGAFDKALDLYEESLVVGRAALGNSHSEVAMLLNRLGNFHFEREQFDGALAAYEEGLEIERRILDKNHPNIVVTLTNIAEIHRQSSDCSSAIRCYEEAMKIQRYTFGTCSAEVASTLNVLGLIYDLQGNSTMALKFLQQALVIRRGVLGDNHLDVSATLTYLGTIFYRRGVSSMALQLFHESFRIRNDKHGRDHRDVSFTLYNIGLCYQMQGDYKEAIRCYEETLRIEQLVLGTNHRDTSMTMFKLGEVYQASGETEKALENFRDSLRIEQTTTDSKEDTKTIARTLNEIGNIYLLERDAPRMMEALSEACRVFEGVGLSPFESMAVPCHLYAFDIACPSSASAA